MEEILDSIKKVIARDSRAPAVEERRRPPSGASAQVEKLAASASELGLDSRTPAVPLPAEPYEEDNEVLDLAEAATLEGEAEDVEVGPLLAANAVSAMRDSLAALATMAAPGAAPQIVRTGETSLEGLVREMLRPMLAEWLDKNLPPLVERLVAAEIARIVGKKV